MEKVLVISTCLLCLTTLVYGSSDDRFIKKYAMMKIYESCFGPEVVKQIRKEMKDAYAKCSAPPSFEEPPNPQIPPILLGKLPPGFAMDPSTQTITKPLDGGIHNQENDLPNPPQKQPMGNVLSFRPQSPGFQQQPVPPYMMPGAPQFRPFNPATPFYQFPYNPNMFYPPGMQYNPYAYQQYQQLYQQPYFGSSRMGRDLDLRDRLEIVSRGPSAGRVRNITCVMQELGYIDHNLEPNYEQITQRISNLPVSSELKGDIQDGLQFCQKFSKVAFYYEVKELGYIDHNLEPNYEQITQRISNLPVSSELKGDIHDGLQFCHKFSKVAFYYEVKELGYIDHNLEPNYEQITQRISNLPVSSELKGDIQDELQFCQKFSQCVPDIKRDVAPLSQELIKPMFFFRCYKHKKLEACIMKDIRERFTTEEDLDTDSDFRSLSRSARAVRDDPLNDPRFEALDEMAVYLYDYLSGSNGLDYDLYV